MLMLGICSLIAGVASCKKSETSGIEYHDESLEETVASTKEVFGSENASEAGNATAGIGNFFIRLGRAARSDGVMELDRFLSIDGMIQALESGGLFEGMSSRDKKGFQAGFRKGAGSLGGALKQMAFDDYKILKVEELAPNDRVIFVRLYDNELNITMQMRWWLINTKDGWKAYDFEDLSVGIRSVSLMGTMMRSGVGKSPEPWIADFLPVTVQMRSVDVQDPESFANLGKMLEKLRQHKLPDDVKRFASTMMTSVLQMDGDMEGSIEELRAAKAGGYESPLYHYLMAHSLMAQEDYEGALVELEKHSEILGWDSDALESLSECHLMLGNIEEARNAALQGLEDNLKAVNCLAALSAASTPEQIREEGFEKYFSRSGNSEEAYEISLDYLISLDRIPQAEALLELLKKDHEESELLEYYDGVLSEEPEVDPEPAEDAAGC
jgi:hypothetical protein